MHARTIGVEDPHHLDAQLVLPVVVEEQRLGAALAFVIAGARADWIDVAPIVFRLRVHARIAIDFGCRRLEDFCAKALGEAEHVDRAMHRRLRRLHRVVLVVDRAGGAGEIPDLVDFHEQREGHVMAQEFKLRIAVQVRDVALLAGEEVIDAQHFLPAVQEAVAQV